MSDSTPAGVESDCPVDSFATLSPMKLSSGLKILAVVFLLFSFGLLLTHFHTNGEHQDCPVCRLIQIFTLAFVFIALFLLKIAPQSSQHLISQNEKLPNSFFRSLLSSRAPPVLS